jgi:hypothetical protein
MLDSFILINFRITFIFSLSSFFVITPGRLGRFPSQAPHRPVRARLTHTVPRDYGFTAQACVLYRVSVVDSALALEIG